MSVQFGQYTDDTRATSEAVYQYALVTGTPRCTLVRNQIPDFLFAEHPRAAGGFTSDSVVPSTRFSFLRPPKRIAQITGHYEWRIRQ